MPGPERTATEVLDRTVFDEAPCLGAIIDVEHRLLRLNRAFSELFGDGPTCHQAVKGAEEPCPECVARQAMADGQVHVSDELGRGPDGAEVSYKVRAVPLCNEGGEVDQVVLLGLDTTPLTALRVELAEVERLAEVGLSTAGLAHTIKNLLSGLDGGKYMVDSGLSKGDDDRIRMGWEMVQGYVDQVSALVRNLLRLVKEDERRPVEVAPGELVDEVVQMLGHKAAAYDIGFGGQVEPELPSIRVDRDGIAAGLANLVANAIEACMWDPDFDEEHRVEVVARAGDPGWVVLEVRDNGPGIAEEHRAEVASRMFTTKGMRGTGLGLVLTRKVVERHGGRLEFTTATGVGTTFHIELPVTEEA